jgi:Ion channel
MLNFIYLLVGILIWVGTIWDGFATVVLPRTVTPMKRLSGRFYSWSWSLWAAIGRRITAPGMALAFLSVYGPISVMCLMIIWGTLMVGGFTLIYRGLGTRFVGPDGPVGFGTLLYMSGSTFMTLGLGDVTSHEPLGRMFMIFESATGFVFLGLIITYMPLLDQAYASREVGNLLIRSRSGSTPSAVRLLHRYGGAEHSDILRGNLREAERWMADILQSHLSHPVLCFYRAQHFGHSWLISFTTTMDTCALLIAAGSGLSREQARLTYRLGLVLLGDLTKALGLSIDTNAPTRLTEADLPALRAALESAGIALTVGPTEGTQLVRMNRRYDVYLQALSKWLVTSLPPWIPSTDGLQETAVFEVPDIPGEIVF